MVAKIQRLGALCLVVFIADSNFGRAAMMAPCISCIELVFLCSVRHGDGAKIWKSGLQVSTCSTEVCQKTSPFPTHFTDFEAAQDPITTFDTEGQGWKRK